MDRLFHTRKSLSEDLSTLGLEPGDGVFVHASMKAVGPVIGGPRMLIEALLQAVGPEGLLGMPGFSGDAVFPEGMARDSLTAEQITEIEAAVPGFDAERSPAAGMGVLAEMFRTWPGTRRSGHPCVSVCVNGSGAREIAARHDLAWATGRDSPFGRMRARPRMKILLIGVGWNRCTPLHTAETLAAHRRVKTRRVKVAGTWQEAPDVADDLNRLFPAVGAAFEETGGVRSGQLGAAGCRICDYRGLVDFAAAWIDRANAESGART
jgi:aminoglycoside 3-N-acetyltransferase